MKKLNTLLVLTLLTFTTAWGQNRVTEDNILGTWKMVIEMDEVMAELDEEAEEAETILEEVILKSVSGVVEGVMDNIQIYMRFERNGEAVVLVNAFDETEEEDEDTEWYIRRGRLYIDDTDSYNSDDDDYWTMKDGVLFLESDETDDDVVVYMVRVDD